MTKDEALKIALEALEDVQDMMSTSDWFNERVEVVRQALAEPDTGIDRGAWADVPDATKWVDDLRGDDDLEETPNSTTDFVGREWQGLTDEEITEAGKSTVEGKYMLPHSFARAIEAKLREKNT